MNAEHRKFIEKNIGSFSNIARLAGDASSREYYRIFGSTKSYILCCDKNFKNIRADEYPFIVVHDLFKKASVPVPEIFDADSVNGAFLLQDLGDDLLEKIYVNLSFEVRKGFYKELIHLLIRIQSIKKESENIIPFTLSFDVEKLMYEFNFFIEHALIGYFNADICANELDELRNEFNKISVLLCRPDIFVLNHRDYHSRNVMLNNSDLFIIDFQDARMGLPQYDLVSILRDSYIQLDADILGSLKDYYFEESLASGIHKMNCDEFDYYFDLMAFQRNVKALGTFGYQTKLKKTTYLEYIKPTYNYLADYAGRRKELAYAYNILNKYIGR